VSAEKYSASMDDNLLAAARRAAHAQGQTLSGWLADAAADRLRLKALRKLVDDWELEHGVITDAELADLDAKIAAARRRAEVRAERNQRPAAS